MNQGSPADATTVWLRDIKNITLYGTVVMPRGMFTKELVGYRSDPVYMSQPVVTTPERKLGYKFMAAEAAWILSGDNRVETIRPYSNVIERFSDDGETFAGAYGPKVLAQLPFVVSTLFHDQDSRQAVINIWRESPGPSKDIPCTLSVQFLVRDGRVDCVDTMRSSDVWLGHPYDVFNFSMLSLLVALALRLRGVKVSLGYLYLNCGSKHLYDKDREAVLRMTGTRVPEIGPRLDVDMFSDPEDLLAWLWARAKDGELLKGRSI